MIIFNEKILVVDSDEATSTMVVEMLAIVDSNWFWVDPRSLLILSMSLSDASAISIDI